MKRVKNTLSHFNYKNIYDIYVDKSLKYYETNSQNTR